ncbi:3-methyl-2-oxobutanoate hydroxymethyltransferase [Mycobacterium sp. AT1]|uniref:3-methyl-2-oxobutanoate hydroxymethyltransferase n=1 Tax=Mycobacterium sp. AT1 TaxID=1961706 RepID=UPI0009CE49BE|nr:3-methyl-2-oxobutanoate hydroxymethyltransferase [Mycobacterium sp. AT1]OPX09594.1 3-methyl-2-oxobutanoate hydroxymethyltransferase [Mycobacterium sp. AT1]
MNSYDPPLGGRPILGNSCARATTAVEMRYRIDRPIRGRQGARVIALDQGAAAIVARIAEYAWGSARFYELAEPATEVGDAGLQSVSLRPVSVSRNGHHPTLVDELDDADVVVMIATTGSDDAAATIIGAACTVRAITTAGLVIGEQAAVADTVAAIRPHARVLAISSDEQDVVDVLTALRA